MTAIYSEATEKPKGDGISIAARHYSVSVHLGAKFSRYDIPAAAYRYTRLFP